MTSLNNVESLWVEKYRPNTIKDCILPSKVKNIMKGYIKNKEIPNLLFFGTPGVGKTTLAKTLINELNANMMFIDASTNNGKDIIENNIIPYASTQSITNPDVKKVILLDEADYLTPQTQGSLRPVIEKYSSTVRFIFTCNYGEKLIPAIKSRCSVFDFVIPKADKPKILKEIFDRCMFILKDNNIEVKDEDALVNLILKRFPDCRKVINELQSYCQSLGYLDSGIVNISSAESIGDELWQLIKAKKFDATRKYIMEIISTPEDIISALFKTMENNLEKEKQPQAVILLSNYQKDCTNIPNWHIHLLAMCVELMQI